MPYILIVLFSSANMLMITYPSQDECIAAQKSYREQTANITHTLSVCIPGPTK